MISTSRWGGGCSGALSQGQVASSARGDGVVVELRVRTVCDVVHLDSYLRKGEPRLASAGTVDPARPTQARTQQRKRARTNKRVQARARTPSAMAAPPTQLAHTTASVRMRSHKEFATIGLRGNLPRRKPPPWNGARFPTPKTALFPGTHDPSTRNVRVWAHDTNPATAPRSIAFKCSRTYPRIRPSAHTLSREAHHAHSVYNS